MPFRWSEYLDLAQELLSRDLSPATDEARMRAAVSRAYYAALQSAKVRLKEKDFDRNIPNDRGIHRYVIEQFRDHPEEARKKIGVDLDRPRKQRDKADYSEVYRDLDQQAELCLKFAQRVRSGLEALPD